MVLWAFGPMANAGRSKCANREEAPKSKGIRCLFSSGGAATVQDRPLPEHRECHLSWDGGLMDNLDLLLEFR